MEFERRVLQRFLKCCASADRSRVLLAAFDPWPFHLELAETTVNETGDAAMRPLLFFTTSTLNSMSSRGFDARASDAAISLPRMPVPQKQQRYPAETPATSLARPR